MHLPSQDAPATTEKKPYEAPVVIDYGDVVEITRTGSGGGSDSSADDNNEDDNSFVSGGG